MLINKEQVSEVLFLNFIAELKKEGVDYKVYNQEGKITVVVESSVKSSNGYNVKWELKLESLKELEGIIYRNVPIKFSGVDLMKLIYVVNPHKEFMLGGYNGELVAIGLKSRNYIQLGCGEDLLDYMENKIGDIITFSFLDRDINNAIEKLDKDIREAATIEYESKVTCTSCGDGGCVHCEPHRFI